MQQTTDSELAHLPGNQDFAAVTPEYQESCWDFMQPISLLETV